ncbi:MAG: CheR family methyltransferase [Syntrophomonadaceae bacterium]|nr:CheR family methyltransferase [Syntrophomonadaceae bacterium]
MAFTYFFRDVQSLEMVRDHALPFLKTRRYINIWDAGCAMGPEPYTLAIILRESMGRMYFRNIRITATDIDASNLFENIIKEGLYPQEQLKRIPRDMFKSYFEKDEKAGCYRVVEELRKAITFQKHDLLSLQAPRQDFGLIICKNVLLHFREEQRIQVIKMFHDSLMEGGFMVFEQTQMLPPEVSRLFEPVVSNAQLFRKCS